jgi:hypothetical protein
MDEGEDVAVQNASVAAPAAAPAKGRGKRQKMEVSPAAVATTPEPAAAAADPAESNGAAAVVDVAKIVAVSGDDETASPAPAAAAAAAGPAAAAGVSNSAAIERVAPEVLSFPSSYLSGPVSAYSTAFDTIAREMLLNMELHANGHVLRVLEIEFYWRAEEPAGAAVPEGGHHVDLFAHACPTQHNNYGRWYWHRQGTKPDAMYKGGNYKGLDVTIGPRGGTGHGGILIRTVQRVEDGAIIEGSCLVAEEVLRMHAAKGAASSPSIVDVVAKWNGNLCAFTNPTLFFARAKHKLPSPPAGSPVVVRSPRVGLTLKQSGESRPRFIMLPYRYCRTDVPGFVNKKMKQHILLSAYEELGGGEEAKKTLQKLCGATPAYIEQHVAAYEAGKKLAKGMEKFVGAKAVTAIDMSEMYGAWMKQFGGKHVAFMRV